MEKMEFVVHIGNPTHTSVIARLDSLIPTSGLHAGHISNWATASGRIYQPTYLAGINRAAAFFVPFGPILSNPKYFWSFPGPKTGSSMTV